MALNREALLGAMKLKTETVALDGGDVIMSELSGPDYIAAYSDPLNRKIEEGKEVMNMGRFQATLIVKGAVDEAGDRLFSDEDINLVERGANGPFLKLAETARKLNGFSGEETKNSDDSQSESPFSDSASN